MQENKKSKKAPDPRILFPLSESPEPETDEALLDVTNGEFDLFELKKKEIPLGEDPELVLDITTPDPSDPFPLKDALETEDDEPMLDATGDVIKGEKFPLKPRKPEEKSFGTPGELILPKTPIRKGGGKNSAPLTALKISTVLVILLAVFFIWLEGGKIYTSYLNKSLYKKFRGGENMSRINEDFDFFLTFEETGLSLPVVKSEKPMYYTTFNSLIFAPGTLTSVKSSTNIIVTGSPTLLKDLSEESVGQYILVESREKTVRYKIYLAHECPKNFSLLEDDGTLTIYLKDSSSENGIFAIHARPEE